MKKTSSLLVATLSSLVFVNVVGCAFQREDTSVNKTLLRQNAMIEASFGPYVGTYSGTMDGPNGSQQPIELQIYLDAQPTQNQDGTTGIRKLPLAHFKKTAQALDFYMSVGGKPHEDGQLQFFNEAKDLNSDDIKTISATIDQRKISGNLFTTQGPRGRMQVELVTTQSTAGNVSNYENRRERIKRLYKQIAGDYTGEIKTTDPKVKNIPITIGLRVFNVANADPTLTAKFHRLDDVSTQLDMTLDVEYNVDVFPPRITMSGTRGPDGNYKISFEGNVILPAQNDANQKSIIIETDAFFVFNDLLGTLTLRRKQ